MKTREITMDILRGSLCFALLTGVVACGGTETVETEQGEVVAVEEDRDAGVMDNWDTDRFDESFRETGYYGGWDENDDALLDEEEFYSAQFDTWDTNNDNRLDENEWNTARNDFGLTQENWRDWDANNDNTLDESEFRKGMERQNFYRDWDTDRDNMISEREYSEGVFGQWDTDQDRALTNEEYDTRFNRYYGQQRTQQP